MLFLLSLFACSTTTPSVTQQPPFTGYNVTICATIPGPQDPKDTEISVAEVGGLDSTSNVQFVKLEKDHPLVKNSPQDMGQWCADVTLLTERDGEAIHVRISPMRRAFTPSKFQVIYATNYIVGGDNTRGFPGTPETIRVGICSAKNGICGIIEPTYDPTIGWWRFNITAEGSDIPTAVLTRRNMR